MNKELKVKVKLFSEKNGGRHHIPKDLLSTGKYRPHLVVGDPNQKVAIVDENNVGTENYLGVTFVFQEGALEEEKEFNAIVATIYPDVDYSSLTKGATFTVREGHKIVGNGRVL